MPETGEDVVADELSEEDSDESQATHVVVDKKMVEAPKDNDDST